MAHPLASHHWFTLCHIHLSTIFGLRYGPWSTLWPIPYQSSLVHPMAHPLNNEPYSVAHPHQSFLGQSMVHNIINNPLFALWPIPSQWPFVYLMPHPFIIDTWIMPPPPPLTATLGLLYGSPIYQWSLIYSMPQHRISNQPLFRQIPLNRYAIDIQKMMSA